MIPQNQEFPHDPEKGIYGDCFRASLASLLELPINQVPHFLYDGDSEKWTERLNEFLSKKGYFLMTFSAKDWDFKEWKGAMRITTPIFHLISDVSPRFPDELHSVVGCDGEVIHDPHPTKQGLPEITEKRTFDFLIPFNPAN